MNLDPTSNLVQRIRSVYDEIAAQFASDNSKMMPELINSGLRFLALPRPAGPLLELGCGAGRDLAWFREQGLRMVGADLSRGMLAEAHSHSPYAPLCQMEMSHIGFRSAAFAGLWCNAALLHLPRANAPAALNEMRRVLLRDGVCFLSLQEGDSEGWETRPNRPARFFTRYRSQDLEMLLSATGFNVLEVRAYQVYERAWLHLLARAK